MVMFLYQSISEFFDSSFALRAPEDGSVVIFEARPLRR